MNYHVPVLLNESISGLSIKPTGTYIDLTFGGGGHTKYILKLLEKKLKHLQKKELMIMYQKIISLNVLLIK